MSVQGREVWEALGDWVTETKPDLGPGTKGRFDMASQLQPDEVIQPGPLHQQARCLLVLPDSIVDSETIVQHALPRRIISNIPSKAVTVQCSSPGKPRGGRNS